MRSPASLAIFAGIVLLFCLAIRALSAVATSLRLQRYYPDRPQRVLRYISVVSNGRRGGMGSLAVSGALEVCEDGLRIHGGWLFGLLRRTIFVPWPEIRVVDQGRWRLRRLYLGQPLVGWISIDTQTIDRMRSATDGRWPQDDANVPGL